MRVLVGSVVMMCLATGCTVKSEDDDRFREAIPQSQDVALHVPGSQAAGEAQTQSVGDLHIQSGDPGTGSSGHAAFYELTRDLADGVDYGTAVVLGSVWAIVQLPPTTVEAHQAVWGPGRAGALEPVVWRFTVTEVGDREYDYELDGRPHTSTNDADFVAVLKGHGWGITHAQHRVGWFVLDHDAARGLDPQREHDSGTVKVSFDLRQLPATIHADVIHTADPSWFNVTVTHQADGSGQVNLTSHGDIDHPNDGKLEDVALTSRWNPQGAGRADALLSGGSLPTNIGVSECWSTTFDRTYYTDTVNYKPTEGTPAVCVFPAATF